MTDLHELTHPVRSVLSRYVAEGTDANALSDDRAARTPSLPSSVRSNVITNEEQIRYLLESVGGVARQTALVEAADWSKSTVSRVLCRMEEDGSVVRYMIGGQNVVYLAGHEPDAFTADPFEDPPDD